MNSFIEICCIIFSFSIVAVNARIGPHIVNGTITKPNMGYQVPFKAWYDPKNSRSRIDYFNGDIKTYQLSNGTHTWLYRINPANDTYGKWKICRSFLKEGAFYQPAIPIMMSHENPESTVLYGTPATKYSIVTGSTLLNYFVREENSIEIPMLCVKHINPMSYTVVHYIYYDEYKPAFDISDKVFEVDADIGTCNIRMKQKYMDPISEFISPVDISFKMLKSHDNIYEKQHSYINAEAKLRREIFRQNLKLIDTVNREKRGYRLGINKFSDRTDEELASLSCGEKRIQNIRFDPTFITENVELPEEFDYRKEGFRTRVKDQQKCGSCYIFGAVGAVEGAYFKKTGYSVNLSEQSLLECATWGRYKTSGGCFGGLGDELLLQVKKMGGIPAEHDYYRQYSAMEPECQWRDHSLIGQIEKVVHVPPFNKTELKKALITYGPLTICISTTKEFYQYIGGVFDDPECTSWNLDHELMLVGYGEELGNPYWLAKNAWGLDWGEGGYIRISQNKHRCGVLDNPFYVILK